MQVKKTCQYMICQYILQYPIRDCDLQEVLDDIPLGSEIESITEWHSPGGKSGIKVTVIIND